MTASNPTSSEAALPRTVVERPPPGLARGKIAAPPWAILLLGAAVTLAAVVYVVRRALARSKR